MKKKVRIPTVLNILLILFILFVSMVILYSVYLSNRLSELSYQIYNHPFVVTNEIKDININLNRIENITEKLELNYSKDNKNDLEKINSCEADIVKSIWIVKDKYSGNKDLVYEVETKFNDFKSILNKNIISGIRSDNNKDLVLQEENLVEFRNSLDLLYQGSINNASTFYLQIDKDKRKLINSMYIFLIITFVYGLVFLFVINVKIKKPLLKVVKRIEDIFDKDTTKNEDIHKMNDIELLVMTIEYLENIRIELKKEINARVVTENNLKSFNDEMKNTMLSKDKLFSIIAHDLINPFQGIIGFSQYLIENCNSITIDEVEELLHHIKDSAISQHSLLQNLLNWSKSQIGELEIKKELLNVYRMIEEVFSNVSIIANAKTLVLINETDPEKYIYSDRRVFVITLNNLITNSIKFSYPGNKIIISETEDNLYKIIKVQDFGCGISSDKIKIIFNTSNKDIHAGTSGEKGSGLGLLICKEFITKQGGKIWAESELNTGSTFFVSFPKEMFQKSNLSFS